MQAPKKVSSTVEEAHLRQAMAMTGESQAETIRRALMHFISQATEPVPMAAAAFAVPLAEMAQAEKAQADMTAAELERCDAALFAARDGLERAIRLLRRKAADPNPPPGVDAVEQTARLNIEIADLEMKLFRVGQKINAFDAGQLTMAPPDEATVSSISDLAESVGRMTVEAQDADTIVDVAKQLAGSAASLVA